MSGILNSQTQKNPPMQREQASIQTQEQGSFQDAFDKFVINGLKILHSEQVTNSIITRVQSKDDSIEALGEIALDVVFRLEDSATQNNFKTTANTIIHGLNVLVGEVINIAQAAGMPPLHDEQKYQAFAWAFSKYLDQSVKSGKIGQEDFMQFEQQLSNTENGQAVAKQLGGM